jgi:hypothetical protein
MDERARTDPDVADPTRPGSWIGLCAAALARAAGALRSAKAIPPVLVPVSVPVRVPRSQAQPPSGVPPVEPVSHLSRLAGIIDSTARHAARADACHRCAEVRIDAALYELEQLRSDLAAVVPPAMLTGTERLLAGLAAECCPPASNRCGARRHG